MIKSAWIIVVFLLAVLFLLLGSAIAVQVIANGFPYISLHFLTEDVVNAGRTGGIAPIIISTFVVVLLACLFTVTVSFPVIIFLSDTHSRETRTAWYASIAIHILAAVPSIVFGLIGNAIFVKWFGFGYSLLAGALTLTLMCLPFFIVLYLEGIRSLPTQYWLAGESLRLSSFNFFKNVIFKSSLPLLASALTLTIGRAVAETAALIFTSGYSTRYPTSVFDSGRTLSVHILDLSMNVSGGDKMAYGTASLLLIVTLFFNILSKGIFKWWNRTQHR